jgi:hypothetical protein
MINESMLRNEASAVARQLFGPRVHARNRFSRRLIEICIQADGKDVLLVHNPGGWGCSPLDHCLEWERSVVEGVRATVERLGYSPLVTQYFRSGQGVWSHVRDIKEQVRIALGGRYSKANLLAAELKFLTRHLDDLRVVMVGVSQGAGFSNAVMRQLGEGHRIYSIELGTPFVHVPRRVVTRQVLAIDSNGEAPDPVVHRDLWIGTRVYTTAPLRWLTYRLIRKPKQFTRCIDLPGHDYNWQYPGVRSKIEGFLEASFGTKTKPTVTL